MNPKGRPHLTAPLQTSKIPQNILIFSLIYPTLLITLLYCSSHYSCDSQEKLPTAGKSKYLPQYCFWPGYFSQNNTNMSPDKQSSKDTNILQWNCRSINTNIHYLVQHLHECKYDYDILCLQSLAVKKEDLPVLKDYYYPPLFSLQEDKVRTAIYVKNCLQISPIRVPVRELSTACEVTMKDGSSLSLVNIYYPESCGHANLTWLQNLHAAHWVVLGDFNAHHSWWGGDSAVSDTAGRQLADSIVASDLCLLNDGSPTRIPDRADHGPTAIDLTLVSPSLYDQAEWETSSELWLSLIHI